MNTTTKTSSQTTTSRFGTLRALGRGIVATSAVAVLGMSSMSAAEASSAGVATGIRYAGTTTTDIAKPSPTDLTVTSSSRYVVRGGKLVTR